MKSLPVQVHNKNENRTYKLSEFIGKGNEYIANNRTGHIYVDNLELLKNNLDFLVYLLEKNKRIEKVSCPSFDIIKYINDNIFNKSVIFNLLDDGKNVDRSYINKEELENINFTVPLVYLLWGVNFTKDIDVSVLQYSDTKCAFSINGNKKFDLEHLKKVKEIINTLNQIKCDNDIEKNIVVSNYIQKNIQYIDREETNAKDGIYVVDPKDTLIYHEKSSLIETVLNEKYGLCMSIANLTTMLLNNPTLNVDIRSVFGCGHVWNIVKIGDKAYYIDNTWSITRNKDRVHNALKAHSFSDEYLFFGENNAKITGYHNAESSLFNYDLDNNNLDKVKVLESKKSLEKTLNYNYGNYVPFNSYKR